MIGKPVFANAPTCHIKVMSELDQRTALIKKAAVNAAFHIYN